jgi:hypothetical protein
MSDLIDTLLGVGVNYEPTTEALTLRNLTETDEEGCITWAEISRLTINTQPGACRLRTTPPDDHWYIKQPANWTNEEQEAR